MKNIALLRNEDPYGPKKYKTKPGTCTKKRKMVGENGQNTF